MTSGYSALIQSFIWLKYPQLPNKIQTFLQVEYCNYAELLELHIFLSEVNQQVVQHGAVVRSQQLELIIWGNSVETNLN